MAEQSIKISINALGGQGGGVLGNWIIAVAEKAGFIPQSTSVPGVAQRTGATIYYIELFPEAASQAAGKAPVLGLMPVCGDVDIVIASELMEAGRAVSRGIVSKKTTLIASSHRVYAMSEKISMGDGRLDDRAIVDAARGAAGRFILADMDALAVQSGTVISAVLFGALAGSGALPIEKAHFEETIRAAKRAVDANLRGFELGFKAASGDKLSPVVVDTDKKISNAAVSPEVAPLVARLTAFPATAHYLIREGLKRMVDFQDIGYADQYLDQLQRVYAVDKETGGGRRDWALLKLAAKHLALWMAFDDTIRVADLKTRASRFARFRDDVHAAPEQIVHVLEYMHPRVEEICDLMPPFLARLVLNNKVLSAPLKFILGGGRRVSTTKLRGFFALYGVASLRSIRRGTYRYKIEMQRIEDWLDKVIATAARDYELALEVVQLQAMIKGYGDTHARGLENYARIDAMLDDIAVMPEPSKVLAMLHKAALGDEEGAALDAAITKLTPMAEAA